MISKARVFVCELESKGGEYEVEVAAVLEVARTKKGCSQEPIDKQTLRDCLSDCRLSCPGEAIQPEDGGCIKVFGPRLDLV